ncbi:hypothetical protein ACH5RR_040583 [Cinchona calisaya]|uniref:CTLH domain-containing protein n=1 Tax=Cinchona calisaya TaxID=153742 RepID=A0ABD2XT96_9GENT
MAALKFWKEMVVLMIQYMKEENENENSSREELKLKGTVHMMEKESGLFFDMEYFEECVKKGEWYEVESYLSGFTMPEQNDQSSDIFFLIREQKYREALSEGEYAKAAEILKREFQVFSTMKKDSIKELTDLLRKNTEHNGLGDIKSNRTSLSNKLKELIQENPVFLRKLQFPNIQASRLTTLISQSLAWQHRQCSVIGFKPKKETILVDHSCLQPAGVTASDAVSNLLVRSSAVTTLPVNTSPVLHSGQISPYQIPRMVVASRYQGSAIKSMDFHPVQQTLLLIGKENGNIALWDLDRRKNNAYQNFKVSTQALDLMASLANENAASVNRVMWSPDGSFCGVAYSKNVVSIYTYEYGDGGTVDLGTHLLIDAHAGNVYDLAFAHLNNQACIITCGEDKAVKVWEITTGSLRYTFKGHEKVCSVCPQYKDNKQYIISTAIDGKIQEWQCGIVGSIRDRDEPGRCATRMAYSSDGTRLFSCGTNDHGKSYLLEWNIREGLVSRSYLGLGNYSRDVVQFETLRNRFLAAGDQHAIKIWDMNFATVLALIGANVGLPASPCFRFNQEGILLAVCTSDNCVKILANTDGDQLLGSSSPEIPIRGASSLNVGPSTGFADRNAPVTTNVTQNGEVRSLRNANDLEKSKNCKMTEINELFELCSLKLPDSAFADKVMRLVYTNSGGGILSLPYHGVHKLWKWEQNEQNLNGKATTAVPPLPWYPSIGISMINDIRITNLQVDFPCFALSVDDSYLVSSSGGNISVFGLSDFKPRAKVLSSPWTTTSLAWHPQYNTVFAIGMDNSFIVVYDYNSSQVIRTLKGHQKRVTGLVFSNVLNMLVSSGADAQICVWSTRDDWPKLANKLLEIPPGHGPYPRLQFHRNQARVLVFHGTLLAVYEAPQLHFIDQWVPRKSSGGITDATYSCDSQFIYASFMDGSICVLTAEAVKPRCRINPTAYIIPWDPSNPRTSRLHPLAIAAHPSESNQFAVGLSDGGVYVLEPLESEGKWGNAHHNDDPGQ